MTDQTADQHILPAFAPVPRAKDRSNGWKPEVQRQFIEALAETGSVKSACRRVNRADHGAYLLRNHPDAHEFRRAWDAALDIGMRRIEDVAALRFAQQIGTLGTAPSTASTSRSTPTARSSAPAPSITTAC